MIAHQWQKNGGSDGSEDVGVVAPWAHYRQWEREQEEQVSLTSDPTDPRLTRGVDAEPRAQAEVYLVLSEDERAKGFVRPYRDAYVHEKCGTETRMNAALSATYARDPKFYGATYCVHCCLHLPVGPEGEFTWLDGSKVGS